MEHAHNNEKLSTSALELLRSSELSKSRSLTSIHHKDFSDYADVTKQLRQSYLYSAVLSIITFPFAISSFRWLNSKATYGAVNLPDVPGQVGVTNIALYKHVNPSILSSAFAESIRYTITMLISFSISLFVGLSALSQTIWLSQEYHLARQSNRGDFGDKLRRRRLTVSVYRFLQTLAALLFVGSASNALFDFFGF